MSVRITDPLQGSWEQAFKDATSNSAAGDPPLLAQFQGGKRKAVLEIDYSLSSTGASTAASLLIQFYNSNESAFTDGITIPLELGKHNLKLDIKGRSGGMKLVDMNNARIDWLDFVILDRETGGN
jgi:hypothetical protein